MSPLQKLGGGKGRYFIFYLYFFLKGGRYFIRNKKQLCYGHHNLGSKRKEVYIDLLTKIMGFNAKQTHRLIATI